MPTDHLELLELSIDSYCGIDKTDLFVFVFPDKTKVAEFKGDQGTGKTSALNFIKRALGAEEAPNAVNNVDKDKKGHLKIKLPNGDIVTCKQTKTSFTVIIESKEGVKSTVTSPKTFLRNLIGQVGMSPMDIKNKSGAEQIKWLKEMFSFTEEHAKLEKQIKDGHKKAYEERRDANRDLSKLKLFLQSSPYYTYDDENKCFVSTPDAHRMEQNADGNFEQRQKEIDEKYVKLLAAKSDLNKATFKIENYNNSIDANNKRIAELRQQIERLENENTLTAQSIEKGNDFIKELEYCEVELPKIKEEQNKFNEIKNEYNGYKAILKNFNEYGSLEEQVIQLNSKLDEYNTQQKNLIKIITPEIEGLEVCLPEGIDEPGADMREGIYYNGKSMAELCESELVTLYIKIKKSLNAKVDIIENISSLGSEAINAINQFIEEGGIVFYSIMDRTEKELKVSFHEKIN